MASSRPIVSAVRYSKRHALAVLAMIGCALAVLHPCAVTRGQGSGRPNVRPAQKLPEPKFSKSRAFSIPFDVRNGDEAAVDDYELELWMSDDRGEHWDKVQTSQPREARFKFRAARDGEYCFAIRERDLKTNKLRPAGPPQVELRVIVDGEPPEVELDARQDPSGQVAATWRLRDDNLDVRAFDLEYNAPGGADRWIPIKTDLPESERDGWQVGETVVFIPDRPTAIVLRATAIDRAGNRTVETKTATLERTASRPRDDGPVIPSPTTRDRESNRDQQRWTKADRRKGRDVEPRTKRPSGGKFPSEPAADADDPRREADSPPAMPNRFPRSKREENRDTLPMPEEAGDGDNRSADDEADGRDHPREKPREKSRREAAEDDSAPPEDPPVSRAKRAMKPGQPAMRATYPSTDDPEAEPEEILPGEPERTEAERERPKSPRSRPEEIAGPKKRERDPARVPRRAMLPTGVEPRRVNFTRFRLEYQVDQVGASGVKEVELWCTRDGGKSWETFGLDPDIKSPMMVQVDEEGTYGFTLVVRNGSGLKGREPRPGDMAEFWVVVDLSKPKALLVSAEAGVGAQSGALVIRWEAEDNQLDDRPIALSYSDSPEGPWSPIAAGLDNSGSYPWAIDEDVPEQAYVRLEVRDAAGNVGMAISERPIPTQQARPEAPILDVSPAENGQSRRIINLR